MSLQLKYTDENGILHINMSPPSTSPGGGGGGAGEAAAAAAGEPPAPHYPAFDTINQRFHHYDIFGGKYEVQLAGREGRGDAEVGGGGGGARSLFRSRYNSVERELANTPYAFATDRSYAASVRLSDDPRVDVAVESPSRDLEDDRFFSATRALTVRNEDSLFGPQVNFEVVATTLESPEARDPPAFSVAQLKSAQDRYFDLSSKQSSVRGRAAARNARAPAAAGEPRGRPGPGEPTRSDLDGGVGGRSESPAAVGAAASAGRRGARVAEGAGGAAFRVLPTAAAAHAQPAGQGGAGTAAAAHTATQVIPIAKRTRESSFAIIAETPASSRPPSPRAVPAAFRSGRTSPFRGRGFREETSRHTTPGASRATSPLRRRTSSLSRLDAMAQVAAMPPPVGFGRPHSPRNYIKQNIEEVREISKFNRERNAVEAEQRRREEREALLKEMGLLDLNADVESTSALRSRSNSPSELKLRSRSNSPSAILHIEKIPEDSKDFIGPGDATKKPVAHRSRLRSVPRSRPQSDAGSPKHSKIPKRQNSVSPTRSDSKPGKNIVFNLSKNQRFISSSTSSINESVRVGGVASVQRKGMSKSSQNINISTSILKSKPPISPSKYGPPPTNKAVNPKRLSPIVGTPNKNSSEDLNSKPSTARGSPKVSSLSKQPAKTSKPTGIMPSQSRFTPKTTNRSSNRDLSPDKTKGTVTKSLPNVSARNVKIDNKSATNRNSSINKTPSNNNIAKVGLSSKPDIKKAVSRINSVRNLSRTNSTKTLVEKQDGMKKNESKKENSELAGSKHDLSIKNNATEEVSHVNNSSSKNNEAEKKENDKSKLSTLDMNTIAVDEKSKQDNETQYDKNQSNENGEHLVPLTKMNVVSMTTAAITSQPLDVVTKVTNQLPTALEKAREKGMFERLGSNDSILLKNDESEPKITTLEKKSSKSSLVSIKNGDNVKLKPLQPPFNNPQVEKARQKIDDILKNPEVSTENILKPIQTEVKSMKESMKSIASTGVTEVKKTATEIKDESIISKIPDVKDYILKHAQNSTNEIRNEATKIVDSIMTPVEEPGKDQTKSEIKKSIEPVVTIVNERPKLKPEPAEIVENMTEAVIKEDPEVEVQSSNIKPTVVENMVTQNKMAVESGSDQSTYSNGGLPKSTSTTPRPVPPARASKSTAPAPAAESGPAGRGAAATPNICRRLMGKCASRCSCCGQRGEPAAAEAATAAVVAASEKKTGVLGKFSCCRSKEAAAGAAAGAAAAAVAAAERGAGKANTVEFENESTKRKRGVRDALCGCCRRQRVGDSTGDVRRAPTERGGCCGRLACWRRAGTDREDERAARRDSILSERPPRARRWVGDFTGDVRRAPTERGGCCGRLACWRRARTDRDDERAARRDSILSERPPRACCNNRACSWLCGLCGKRPPAEPPSRRTSMFSKNKSLSPTLPVEDTRRKLDTTLVEHTSSMRGAIPALPVSLAYFCLVCNVLVPGLGTVFSGMLCLCFGVPRFGVHDGLKPRVGSLLINIAVGAAQLFTVLFCLVGWGWSIWWGTIMLKVAKKYRKLRESAAAEHEREPPVTATNHTARA